ncbi:MAG: hypothetical protein H6807_16315 [Planctomycetes bacterium]|nr:hypothetical protein [Planctomycetota bacterium]
MHSAVLQNKKYIKFAEDNTVEVLSLSRLEEGIEKGDQKAAKYKTKDAEGKEVEYMVSWPNLSLEMIQAINQSKAGQFNKTGKIPYTSIVNPHTQEEMAQLLGGRSAKQLMESVEEARKKLEEEHGKGLARQVIARCDDAIAKAKQAVADDNWDGAIALLEKAGLGDQKTHEVLAAKLKQAQDDVVAAARARFDEVKAMEAKDQKRELNRIISKNKKTGLEAEIREALLALKEA